MRQPSLFSPPPPAPTPEELALGDKDREVAITAGLERQRRSGRLKAIAAEGRAIKIGLVGCSKTKRREPSPARDLYVSNLFRAAIAYAGLACDEVYILSAQYGLVEPDQVIAPYDHKLMDLGKRSRMAWGERVAEALRLRLPRVRVQLVFFAGIDYVEPVQTAALRYGWVGENPLRTMTIGRRRVWLVGETARLTQAREHSVRKPGQTSKRR